MFERRLTIVLLIPVLGGAVIVARLYELQVVRGEAYQRRADEALVSPRRYLPPLRGRILDRSGKILVSDEPAHDVTVHYGALSMSASYLQRLANNLRRRDPSRQGASSAELESEVQRRIAKMWNALARASDTPLSALVERRNKTCASVENLRRYIWNARRRRGFEEPIEKLRLREEDLFHPMLRGVSPEVRTQIEVAVSDLPFVRIEPSVRRVWRDDTEPLCHVLGVLGQVTNRQIKDDPFSNDPLRAYRAGGEAGVTGIERLAESTLRGKRGFEDRFLDGALKERRLAVDGSDVRLSIDLDLQRGIAGVLREAVAEDVNRTGAACAVIDVQSREILALVSVPTYAKSQLEDAYRALRDDAEHRPLLFRAVMEEYQPGSIVKPVVLLAGFRHHLVDPDHTIFCDGSFIAGSPNWHCWTHWKGLSGHGDIAAEEAIMHSCNVYFYGLGQRLNARRLTEFFADFVYGPERAPAERRGTGLIEERAGIIPTIDWIRRRRNRGYRVADGRNYAIGQGEMQITPMQAANIFATLAAGRFQSPTIIANDPRPRPAQAIPGVSREAWQMARRGLFRCVNEAGGTAFRYARLEDLEICGKTGSAQCVARAVEQRFTFELEDGNEEFAVAPTVEAAREILGLPQSTRCRKHKVLKRWPPPRPEHNEPPTHSWFAGFAPYSNPKVAVAVIVEHGGSGGQTAGPLGRAIFEAMLESSADYLTTDATTVASSARP